MTRKEVGKLFGWPIIEDSSLPNSTFHLEIAPREERTVFKFAYQDGDRRVCRTEDGKWELIIMPTDDPNVTKCQLRRVSA